MAKLPRAALMAVVTGSAAVALLGVATQSASAAPVHVSVSAPATQLYCAWKVYEETTLDDNGAVYFLQVGWVVYGTPPAQGQAMWAYSTNLTRAGWVSTRGMVAVSCKPIPSPE